MSEAVWVVMGEWDYEGGSVLSVHASEDSAKAAIERCKAKRCSHDSHEIEPFTVEGSVKP